MNTKQLMQVAQAMVADGKGILAADESIGTIEKRFTKINVENSLENRRAYRELLFTSVGIGDHISGAILFDETLRDSASDGRTFMTILKKSGVLPGIKVDQGTKDMDTSTGEKVTKGLEGLSKRLEEYGKLGAKFAKWRAVITIGNGTPSDANIRQNAKDLAVYAHVCQENGIVPMVEPEVLMDGEHSMKACEDASYRTLVAVFEELDKESVALEGMILKTNMVIPAKESGEKASPEKIANGTLALFKKVLPHRLPGQTFLSGGQSEIEATENLNAMNQTKNPWKLSFSYGRALQDSALKAWRGKNENIPSAQKAFLHRAKMNGLAAMGRYKGESA